MSKFLSGAACSALFGALAAAVGCGSTTTVSRQVEDAGTDATPPPPAPPPPADDGGAVVDAGACSGVPNCENSCPITTADLDARFGWEPPPPIQSVCMAADIKALSDAFDNVANKTYDDVVKDISGKITNTACLACIVTNRTAPNWGPIVKDAMTALPNFGACYAAFPSSNDACGKAKHDVELCMMFECDCTMDYAACVSSKLVKTACADPIDAYQTACAGVPGSADPSSAINKACGDIIDAASTLCQGGVYDGGMVDGG